MEKLIIVASVIAVLYVIYQMVFNVPKRRYRNYRRNYYNKYQNNSNKYHGYKSKNNKKSDASFLTFNGILNNTLLTPTELSFFKRLKTITDKYNLVILSKVRVADIITTNTIHSFVKIRATHIDFTICTNDTKPIMFIELDDASHNNPKNKENDLKKDYIFSTLNIKIYRVKVGEESKELCNIDSILKNRINRKEVKIN